MRRFVEQLREHDREHRRALEIWAAHAAELSSGSLPDADPGLTVCSVGYRARFCLEQNVRLLRALNPGSRVSWLVLDNNSELRDTIASGDFGLTVFRSHRREGVLGYEHALAISALLPHIRTRFALFLDPDCFIVEPGWVQSVPEHMERHQLSFFGTPINPRRYNSYRYFPYMVCMFVDLAQVPPRDLCFVPDVWAWRAALNYAWRQAMTRIPKVGFGFRWLLTERWLTNGWRIKAKFRHSRFECVQPVWDVNESIPGGSLKRLIHALTPGSVSPIPKQRGYCSPVGFAAMGAPEVAALGWEEFVWQGRPFAFHVGSIHGKPGKYETQLEATLRQFASPQAPELAQAH